MSVAQEIIPAPDGFVHFNAGPRPIPPSDDGILWFNTTVSRWFRFSAEEQKYVPTFTDEEEQGFASLAEEALEQWLARNPDRRSIP